MPDPITPQAPVTTGQPVATPGTPAPVTQPALASPSPTTPGQPYTIPGSIPKGLEKFSGPNGLDYAKIGQSYLDSENRQRQLETENQRLQQTVTAIQPQAPAATPGQSSTKELSEAQLQKLVTDPEGFVEEILGRVSAPVVEQLNQVAITSAHPEMKDEAFKKSFFEWYDQQPEFLRQAADEKFEGADYMVKRFKESSGFKAQAPTAPHMEAPSGSKPSQFAGARFSKQGMSKLYISNPQEYGRLYPEYAKAYREGRVDP